MEADAAFHSEPGPPLRSAHAHHGCAQRNYPFQTPIIVDVINPNFKSAYMQQWNLSIQRELSKNFLITMAYAGSKGTDLHYDVQINPAIYTGSTATVANTDQRRPLFPL